MDVKCLINIIACYVLRKKIELLKAFSVIFVMILICLHSLSDLKSTGLTLIICSISNTETLEAFPGSLAGNPSPSDIHCTSTTAW
jgi:hypothetical protein